MTSSAERSRPSSRCIALALLMAAGLAVDGGRKVNALREASQPRRQRRPRRRPGHRPRHPPHHRHRPTRPRPRSATAVDDYLTALGHTATRSPSTGDTITVTVDLTVDPVLLPTGPITVTATETATAITEEP